MLLDNQEESRIKIVENATVTASDISLFPAYQQLINRHFKYRIHITDSLQAY